MYFEEIQTEGAYKKRLARFRWHIVRINIAISIFSLHNIKMKTAY